VTRLLGLAQFGPRLGANPRQVITTTPRPIPLIRDLLARDGKSVTVARGTTFDNRENLPANYLETIAKQYAAAQLERQELNAELIDDVAGALWTRRLLDLCGLADAKRLPPM